MTRPGQKTLERHQLALVCSERPGFLPEDAVIADGNERDEPDLILTLSSGKVIGLELTALRDRGRIGGYEPAQIEAARRKIIEVARTLHAARGGPRMRVNASMGPGPCDIAKTAQILADMIQRHDFCANGIDLWPAKGSSVELHASFWPCAEDEEDLWSLVAAGQTKVLSPRQIEEAIEKKGKRAREGRYRSGFDERWLLIVATLLPSSSDFSAPTNAQDWFFPHPFDAVFVHCQGSRELLRY
mgnify:CR=1 FL=1